MRHPPRLLFGFVLILAILALGAPSVALAAPANDNQANATVISSLPFSDSVDISQATTEFGETTNCGATQTVWYAITPSTDGLLKVDTSGSSFFGTDINAYRQDGAGLGGLMFLNCATFSTQLTFSVQAGVTYYLQAGSSFGGGSILHLTVSVLPPPANDK